MTFKGPFTIFFSLTIFVGVLIVFKVVTIGPEDRKLYQTIQQQTQALNSTQALERNPSTQIRKEARKDIWTEDRLHFQMSADQSKLTLKQKKDKVEATEELENIICQNTFGKIVAKKGSFDYPDQQFHANQVTCTHALGILEAQTATLQSPDEKLILEEGVTLKSKDFSLHSKKAVCEIQNKNQQIEFFKEIVIQTILGFKATGDQAIYQNDHLNLFPETSHDFCHLAKNMDFDLKSETVYCKEPQGTFQNEIRFNADTLVLKKDQMALSDHVHLEQVNIFSIDCDSCIITLKENTPSQIEIHQNVRFVSKEHKETFGLADSILYFPQEQKFILSAIAPKRVLFWQEGKRISAPEICIQKHQIQGNGDVRFTFHVDEQNRIDQHFSKYLYIPFLQ
jgi:hypothetical protein